MAEIQSYLNTIKSAQSGESVRDAIIQCMNAINSDTELEIVPKVIHSNGTYHSGNGKAWKTVTVDVESGGGEETQLSFAAFNVTDFTENGTYTPQSEGYDENTYFNEINVDISQQLGLDGVADAVVVDQVATDDKGQYYDMSWVGGGVWAAKRVYFSNEYMLPEIPDPEDPTPGGKKYTVKFTYDDGSAITTITGISSGENALALDTKGVLTNVLPKLSSHDGWSFAGWDTTNGDVYSVKKSFTTKALFIPPTPGEAGEISDGWAKICEDRGAHYKVGDWKWLNVEDGPIQLPAMTMRKTYGQQKIVISETIADACTITSFGPLKMMKVSGPEVGSTSTWLSCTPLTVFTLRSDAGGDHLYFDRINPEYLGMDYIYSTIVTFFNEYFIGCFPSALKSTIKYTEKTQWGSIYPPNTSGESIQQNPRSKLVSQAHKIWLPSVKEISHLFAKDSNGRIPSEKCLDGTDPTITEFESTGKPYTVWQPEIIGARQDVKIWTRSCAAKTTVWSNVKEYGLRVLHCTSDDLDPETGQYIFDYVADSVLEMASMRTNVGTSYGGYGCELYIGFCL